MNISEYTIKQCKAELAAMNKIYKFDRKIEVLTDELNDMINKFMLLEDRITELEHGLPAEPKAAPIPRRPYNTIPRRLQSPKGIFESLDRAAEELGVKKSSIIGYISNKRPGWYYLED